MTARVCPRCGGKLEGEAAPIQEGVGCALRGVQAAHYRCDGCDSEWATVGREPLRLVDGGDVAPLDAAALGRGSF